MDLTWLLRLVLRHVLNHFSRIALSILDCFSFNIDPTRCTILHWQTDRHLSKDYWQVYALWHVRVWDYVAWGYVCPLPRISGFIWIEINHLIKLYGFLHKAYCNLGDHIWNCWTDFVFNSAGKQESQENLFQDCYRSFQKLLQVKLAQTNVLMDNK